MNREHLVLHVDDDPAILRIVQKKLTSVGYEVISIDDPRVAMERILETGVRVILLDIDMPHIDGLELLKQIKAHDGGLQVIMLTGMVTMTTVMQSMMQGAEACVFKPLDEFESLLSVLDMSFEKIDRWWNALYDRSRRIRAEETEVAAS
jgi:DNA-binding NtrC family response regulator